MWPNNSNAFITITDKHKTSKQTEPVTDDSAIRFSTDNQLLRAGPWAIGKSKTYHGMMQ